MRTPFIRCRNFNYRKNLKTDYLQYKKYLTSLTWSSSSLYISLVLIPTRFFRIFFLFYDRQTDLAWKKNVSREWMWILFLYCLRPNEKQFSLSSLAFCARKDLVPSKNGVEFASLNNKRSFQVKNKKLGSF